MPCRTDDYPLNTDDILAEYAKLSAFIEELEKGELPSYYNSKEWTTQQEVYFVTGQMLDRLTRSICSTIINLDLSKIKNLSKELQLWWENHKRFDIERLTFEIASLQKAVDIGKEQLNKKEKEIQEKKNRVELLNKK